MTRRLKRREKKKWKKKRIKMKMTRMRKIVLILKRANVIS
jgi:hypothetical protein